MRGGRRDARRRSGHHRLRGRRNRGGRRRGRGARRAVQRRRRRPVRQGRLVAVVRSGPMWTASDAAGRGTA